jgi:hypothetical protein
MNHYAANVHCTRCGHRFTVCVHCLQLVLSGDPFTVFCPENGSKVQVPAKALMAVDSCPAGAVIVRDTCD